MLYYHLLDYTGENYSKNLNRKELKMNERHQPYPKISYGFAAIGRNGSTCRRTWLIAFVLYLLFAGAMIANEENGVSGEQDSVRVSIKVKNPDSLGAIAKMRGEIETLKAAKEQLTLDNQRLLSENSLLRQELVEIVDKSQQQNADYSQLQLGIATMMSTGKVLALSDREARLVRGMKEMSESGMQLSLHTAEFCNEVDSVLGEVPIGKNREVELRLRKDELLKESREFGAYLGTETLENSVDKTRILSVNPDLQVVALPIGWIHGAVNGLTLRVTGKNAAVLKIVLTRPSVSLAVVVEGEFSDLTVGMEVGADVNKQNE